MTRWIYIALFLGMSQIATSQEVYGYHVEWDSKEVVGDSVLNKTYDIIRGSIYVYSDYKLDSLKMDWTIGSGVRKWGGIMYEKGYIYGYKVGLEVKQHDYEVMRWIFAGTVVFIVTWATLESE